MRDSRRFIETLEELLRVGYPARFRADGWSMYPAIRNGDVITVAPLGGSPIRIGDVVLYRYGRAAIAHRVVRVESPSGRLVEHAPPNLRNLRLVLRGDAADCCDAPIASDRVLGKVVAVGRNGRPGQRGLLNGRWSRLIGCAMRRAHSARTTLAAATFRGFRVIRGCW